MVSLKRLPLNEAELEVLTITSMTMKYDANTSHQAYVRTFCNWKWYVYLRIHNISSEILQAF